MGPLKVQHVSCSPTVFFFVLVVVQNLSVDCSVHIEGTANGAHINRSIHLRVERRCQMKLLMYDAYWGQVLHTRPLALLPLPEGALLGTVPKDSSDFKRIASEAARTIPGYGFAAEPVDQ